MNKPAKENGKKLQYRIDLVLTALFLVMIFFFGIMTPIMNFEDIYRAGSTFSQLKAYLPDPEHYNAWELFCARIRSVDTHLNSNIYLSEQLGYLNSTFQYKLGKRLIATGSSKMVTLNSGHLYDLQNYVPMQNAAEEIATLKAQYASDIPFVFIYEHPTIYEADQMPEGYGEMDYSDEIADEITTLLREKGIEVMDSRVILPATGLAIEDYLMYTDQHWATRAGMILAQAFAEKAEEMTGIDLNPELLDYDQFETETFPKLFLGKYGQRVGPRNIDPDDITVYYPKYETDITRRTLYSGEVTETTGSFKEAAIRWNRLVPDAGKTWNKQAYMDYGLTESYDVYTNPNGADCTILLLKDSYSTSIAAFLSLVANEVVALDMRHSDVGELESWIEAYEPDIMVVSYSMQMLRDDAYEFQ